MKLNGFPAFLLFVLLPVCLMTIAFQVTGFAVSIVVLLLVQVTPIIDTNMARFFSNLMSIAGAIGILIILL